MEDFIEVDFVASEIDLDYEFDAARFFDFTRPESISETDEAEHWFESAGSYPPSRKLLSNSINVFFFKNNIQMFVPVIRLVLIMRSYFAMTLI